MRKAFRLKRQKKDDRDRAWNAAEKRKADYATEIFKRKPYAKITEGKE